MADGTGKRVAQWAVLAGLIVLAAAAWLGREHLRLWWRYQPLGRSAQGYPEYRHRLTGIVFVRVPGGKFLMGSPPDEEGRRGDERQHEVALSPFLIAKHEVTQDDWRKVMDTDPSRLKGGDLPVQGVTWEECQDFCSRTGLEMPTEAQWEYACRAGTAGPFAGTVLLNEVGWYREQSGMKVHPIGQKRPNGFGLHDMHGNVGEWCEDIHDAHFYSTPEAAGPDPVCRSGPANQASGMRVVRGGSWTDEEEHCRAAARYTVGPRADDVGFRPAASCP